MTLESAMHDKRTGKFAAAALVGLCFVLGATLDIRGAAAAAAASGECSPAEPPMGNARDALGGRNKDNGLSAQQRAIEELQRCITDEKDAAKRQLDELSKLLNNLQMATPGMDDEAGDDDMMSALDELGDMIRQQQNLRDRTFRQGQDQRQQGQQRGPQSRPGQQGQQQGNSLGELRQNQQALRDRLNQLLEELKNLGQNQGGQQDRDNLDQLGRAGEAMGQAENDLAQGNPDSAVDAQGRALEALRKGAQSLAQAMQQQMGQGPGPMGRVGRLGPSRADQQTDPLGRPLRGRDYGDDTTVRVPGEIDVQRARRIIEELRKRFGDMARPQEELDYIERLLKDY
jgi:uncharacterized protein (TIGR02302 family)